MSALGSIRTFAAGAVNVGYEPIKTAIRSLTGPADRENHAILYSVSLPKHTDEADQHVGSVGEAGEQVFSSDLGRGIRRVSPCQQP